MKKKIFALLLLSGMYARVFAQSYSVQPIPFIPFSFNAGTIVELADDSYSEAIPLGFDFCFFGQSYDTIFISSNSYVSFDTSGSGPYSPWSIHGPFPDSTLIRNVIMFPWQDLLPPSGGEVRYNVYGTPPCRKFVVSYDHIAMFSCTNLSFSNQVVLYEGSNVIDTYIENKPLCSAWNSGQAVHGLQNAGGSEAIIIPGRNAATQWQATNDAYRFIALTCLSDTNSCTLLSDSTITRITGKLFADINNSCSYENGDDLLSNRWISIMPGNDSSITQSDGSYDFFVLDTGTYSFDVEIPSDMQITSCPQQQISVLSLGDTLSLDLMVEPLECAKVYGIINMPGHYVRCDTIEILTDLVNMGIISSGNITLNFYFDNQFTITDCNYNYTTSTDGDTLIVYLPGGLLPDEHGVIVMEIVISCNSEIMLCVEPQLIVEALTCPNTSSLYGTCTYDITSTEEYAMDQFKIYPNPSRSQVTISGITSSGDHLQLIDITGRILRTYTLNGSSTTLNIDGVAAGFYTFSITDSKNAVIGNGKIQILD